MGAGPFQSSATFSSMKDTPMAVISGASRTWGAPSGPPIPPSARRAPAKPWRASIVGPPLAALLENRLERELAADGAVGFHGLEAGHRVVVDVTVLVEAPLAVDPLEVLRRRDGLAHGLALLGDVLRLLDLGRRALDGVEDDARALGRVERVGGRLLAELRLVRLVGLGADAPHLLEGQAGEGHPHVGRQRGVAGGTLEELFLQEAVGSHE